MQTSASPRCCVIWSGLHQHAIGEAIDHVAWTAAWLCENWCTRLLTLAVMVWTLPVILRLCGDFISDVADLPHDVLDLQGTVRTYETRCGGLCICVCFKFPGVKFLPRIGKIGWNIKSVFFWDTVYILHHSSNRTVLQTISLDRCSEV